MFCLGECLCAVEVLRSPGMCSSIRHWRTRTCKGGYRSPLCNPRSRPTTSPLRGSLGSISSLQVGRDTASCLSRPQAQITRPIPGPRPCGAAASGVQKRSRRFCPCGPDLARQLRLGDVDAGHNPTADILVFSVRACWRFCARDLACLLCLGEVDAGPGPKADIFVFSVKAYLRFCVPDLARQLRLGDVDAGHNPTAGMHVL